MGDLHGPDTDELLRTIEQCDGITLNVESLNITSLPKLPAGLQYLFCYDTQLSVLPKLPAGLQELDCFNTPLTVLPELPPRLQILHCNDTLLSVLPTLPAGLRILHCNDTPLSVLPKLPAGLQVLDCSNTPLSVLPTLPAGLRMLDCSRCPNLLIQRNPGESVASYEARWKEVRMMLPNLTSLKEIANDPSKPPGLRDPFSIVGRFLTGETKNKSTNEQIRDTEVKLGIQGAQQHPMRYGGGKRRKTIRKKKARRRNVTRGWTAKL